MKTKLRYEIDYEYSGNAFLVIPPEFLAHLGWKEEDDLILDIPSTHSDQIVIHRKEPSNG